MRSPSLAEFKRFSADVAPAARAVLMARVHAELTRERVDAYIRPVFERYTFTVRPEWGTVEGERITDPKRLYLSAEEDLVASYFEDCDQAHRAHGFTGPKGHCPALVAEHLLVQAEQCLIDLASPLFGVKLDVYGDDRKRLLELLIGAALKAEQKQGAA